MKNFLNILKIKKSNFKRISLILVLLVLMLGMFTLGLNIGNGNISFFNNTNETGLPSKLNYKDVNQLYSVLRANYDGRLSESQILNGIMHGLANSPGDPYTEYFTKSEASAFNSELNNSFTGIGAELSKNSAGDIEVIAPLSGYPAAKAGLRAQDVITSINNVSTSGMRVETAVNDIRGPAGTKVTLGILRGNQNLNISIVRETITIPSVNTKILKGNIGYMQIISFANDTSTLAYQAAQKFKSEHVKGIILDLRNDPGGLLSAAINVSSLWVNNASLILQEKRGNTVIDSYYGQGDNILSNIPTVVLINSGTASSAEITTGALHDNHQAYVIGTKSFGKGVVQELFNLNNGAVLKVTVASWYRPNGQDINKKGISPDQTVQLTPSDIKAGNDTQLNAALNYLASK